MRYYPAVGPAIPRGEAGHSRVTHPFAGRGLPHALDLHVLSTPPAFVLSQDQTLQEFNAQWLSERLSRCSVSARQRVRITQNDQVKTLPEALIGPGSTSSPRTLLRSQARLSNSTNVASATALHSTQTIPACQHHKPRFLASNHKQKRARRPATVPPPTSASSPADSHSSPLRRRIQALPTTLMTPVSPR